MDLNRVISNEAVNFSKKKHQYSYIILLMLKIINKRFHFLPTSAYESKFTDFVTDLISG